MKIKEIKIENLNNEKKYLMIDDKKDLLKIFDENINYTLIENNVLFKVLNEIDVLIEDEIDEIDLINNMKLSLRDLLRFFKILEIKKLILFYEDEDDEILYDIEISLKEILLTIFKKISSLKNKKYIIDLNNLIYDNENTYYFYDDVEINYDLKDVDFIDIIDKIDDKNFDFNLNNDIFYFYYDNLNYLCNFKIDDFNYDLIKDFIYDIINYIVDVENDEIDDLYDFLDKIENTIEIIYKNNDDEIDKIYDDEIYVDYIDIKIKIVNDIIYYNVVDENNENIDDIYYDEIFYNLNDFFKTLNNNIIDIYDLKNLDLNNIEITIYKNNFIENNEIIDLFEKNIKNDYIISCIFKELI